jgi:hypothetical protein
MSSIASPSAALVGLFRLRLEAGGGDSVSHAPPQLDFVLKFAGQLSHGRTSSTAKAEWRTRAFAADGIRIETRLTVNAPGNRRTQAR